MNDLLLLGCNLGMLSDDEYCLFDMTLILPVFNQTPNAGIDRAGGKLEIIRVLDDIQSNSLRSNDLLGRTVDCTIQLAHRFYASSHSIQLICYAERPNARINAAAHNIE